MEWNDINEKLPQLGDNCLVVIEQAVFDKNDIFAGYTEKKIQIAKFLSKSKNGWGLRNNKHVLYWMKLPETPN